MTSLINLYFKDSKFSGTIPTEIGNLQNLQIMYKEPFVILNSLRRYLSGNQFNGTIPQTLGNSKSLTEMCALFN